MNESNSIPILTDIPEFDKPTEEFRQLSKIICDVVNGSDPEFTIGIYGKWGTGKTTLMRNVQKKLETEYAIDTIWFNAWRYEREQVLATMPLVAVILDSLSTTLEEQIGEQRDNDDISTKAKRTLVSLGKKFVKGSKISIKSGILDNGMEYTFDPSKITEDNDSDKIDVQKSIPPLHKGVNLIADFLSALDKGNSTKLVVFIDDLDRCSPETTLAVFESVKILLNMKGMVHVMGISREAIGNLIKEKFQTQEIDDEEYIQKIIQLPIFIPDWKSENIKSLVSKNILEKLGENSVYYRTLKDKEELLTIVAKSNPREAKRIVNQFMVDYEFTKLSNPKIFSDISEKELDENRFSIFVISLLRILNANDVINVLSRKDSDSEILVKMIKEIIQLENEDDYENLITKWNNNKIKDKDDKSGQIELKYPAHLTRLFSNKDELYKFFKSLKEIENIQWNLAEKTVEIVKDISKQDDDLSRDNLLQLLQQGMIIAFNEIRSKNHTLKINLQEIDLRQAYLMRADLRDADLERANLDRASLVGANMVRANLIDVHLREADLREADLERANLMRANMIKAKLSRADLRDADLREVRLTGANMRQTSLIRAILRGADLTDVDLTDADLSGADLRGANLHNVNLDGANLHNVNLDGADLTNANLIGVDRYAVNLEGAKNIPENMV